MAHKDLNQFLEILEREGELKRISVPLSPVLEISEITDRVSKKGGPALLFEKVEGHHFPVVTNLFGSEKRMRLCLGGRSPDEVGREMKEFLEMEPPDTLWKSIKALPRLHQLSKFFPKKVEKGPCQEVVLKEPDISLLPALQCWPEDGGRFITFPVVITKDPETGKRNVGMYRLQVFDSKTLGVHWHPQKGGAHHFRMAERRGERLEVAVALGPDPATLYSATAPLPEGMDEFVFAGFLRGEPVEMVKCATLSLEVPACSQFVIEGYVEPGERRMEGPFGDHTGFYSLPDLYPVMHVTTLTHRKDAIYPTTVVGIPPMEDSFLGKATERIFLPLIKMQLPEIIDIHMPVEGVFHNLVFISIDKRYPGHARKIGYALWGMGQMMFSKMIVVFDGEVDVQNLSECLWILGANIDPKRDVFFSEGPVDALDHASGLPHYGSKMGIDATKKWPEEGFGRPWPKRIEMDPDIKKRIDQLWKSFGLE
ncbi:MAG: menaquinone biosynthesis decarboxylase [Thermodesulfobacteriota bacterium]|nr:menaquinone biosynthesis decarboxylase [Thermodesulfobacteriota bacterium]